jgi:hypothetical protein
MVTGHWREPSNRNLIDHCQNWRPAAHHPVMTSHVQNKGHTMGNGKQRNSDGALPRNGEHTFRAVPPVESARLIQRRVPRPKAPKVRSVVRSEIQSLVHPNLRSMKVDQLTWRGETMDFRAEKSCWYQIHVFGMTKGLLYSGFADVSCQWN